MKTVLIDSVAVPLLSVRDMIEVGDAAWHWERANLIADLEASGATTEQRLAALKEQSARRGTALILLVASMRIEVAEEIIRRALKAIGSTPDRHLSMCTPAKLIQTAQALLGYEPDGDAEGKA